MAAAIKDSADLLAWIKQVTATSASFCLGTVQQVGPVYVQFDGEIDENGVAITTPVSLVYLDSYLPTVGDRVVLLKVNGAWMILGSVAAGYPDFARLTKSTTTTVADATWVEVPFNGIDNNGGNGAPALASGSMSVVPGNWEFKAVVSWPTAASAYVRTICATSIAGGGSGGPPDAFNRHDLFTPVVTNHPNQSGGMPVPVAGAANYSAYIWQNSGASVTVAANSIYMTGKRVG